MGFKQNLGQGGLVQIQAADSPSISAFGGWRTTEDGHRLDIEFILDKQPLLFDEVTTGNCTVTHNSVGRDLSLAVVDTTTTVRALMRSKSVVPYTPGSGQKIEITGALDETGIGTGTAAIFLRNNGSETTYNQGSWLKDNVPDVDWSKSQIVHIDLQSLKVGRVRIDLVRKGGFTQLHNIYNDNLRTGGYWQYASLPLTWEIENTGTQTIARMGYFDDNNGVGMKYTFAGLEATAALRAICGTVKSEGGQDLFDMPGFNFPADMGATPAKTISSTLLPLISIRPKTTLNSLANYTVVIPTGYTVQTDNAIRLVFLINATLNGSVWTDAATVGGTEYSGVEYNTDSTTVSNGIPVDSVYLSTDRNTNISGGGLLGRDVLSLTPDGTQTTLTIAAVKTGTTDADVLAGLKWKEIR